MTRNAITLQDVYNVVNRLEDKIDRRMTDIEIRQDRQESVTNKAIGVITVFSTFTGVLSTWVWDRIMGRSN